jgi:hypothetical protein
MHQAPRLQKLAAAADEALGVERELHADDLVVIEQHESGVGALDVPRDLHRPRPLVGRDPSVQLGIQKFRRAAHVAVGDRGHLDPLCGAHRHIAAVAPFPSRARLTV